MGRTNQMSMLGNIGQPSRPSVPDGKVVQAALDLLVALGNKNPEAAAYLSSLKNSGDHNTKLLADIQHELAQLGDLKTREAELVANERRVDAKLAELAAIRRSWGEYEKTV